MSVRGYQVAFDWSGLGTYGNAVEDVTDRVLDEPDITVSYGRDQARTTSQATASKMTVALRNDDRILSPENILSPIYGQVRPGRAARLLATDPDDATHVVFGGVIDDVDADPQHPAKAVTLSCLDAWGRPDGEDLSTELYSGLRTGDAIGIVLDEIGWTGPRDIDPGATLMPWWWEEDTSASDAVAKLVESEGPPAIAYVDGGTFVFRDRHHRLTNAVSQTSQALFTHLAGTTATGDFKVLRDSFTYDHGLRNIANAVTFAVPQRAPAEIAEVWAADAGFTLNASESTQIFAQASEPFFDAATPVDGVDFETRVGTVTVALSRTSGQSVILTVTATAGGPAEVTRLAFQARAVQTARTVKVSASDTASIGTYGRQAWPGSVPWANAYDAQAIATRIVAIYAANRPTVTFSIANINDDYLAQILQRRISDRISVRNDEIGLDAEFVIERVEHTIRKLGMVHRVEFGCEVAEPVQPVNILTFGVAGQGFNQGAFGVDGINAPSTMFRFDTAGQGFNQGVFTT